MSTQRANQFSLLWIRFYTFRFFFSFFLLFFPVRWLVLQFTQIWHFSLIEMFGVPHIKHRTHDYTSIQQFASKNKAVNQELGANLFFMWNQSSTWTSWKTLCSPEFSVNCSVFKNLHPVFHSTPPSAWSFYHYLLGRANATYQTTYEEKLMQAQYLALQGMMHRGLLCVQPENHTVFAKITSYILNQSKFFSILT